MTSACGVPFSRLDILPFGTALEVYVPVVIDNVQMDHWVEYLAAIVGVASGYGAEEVAFFVNDGEQFVSIVFHCRVSELVKESEHAIERTTDVNLVVEDAKECTAAATHLCIDGSLLIQALLDVGKFGMQGKQRFLKIVCEFVAPSLDGLSDNVATTLGWHLWDNVGKGFLRRDGNVWFDDTYIVGVKRIPWPVGRFEYLSDTRGIRRLGCNEECAVGTQSGCIALHLCIAHIQPEPLVQQTYHVSSIARATSKSCLRWYLFEEVGVDAWKVVVLGNQGVCLDHQIVLLVTGNGNAIDFEVACSVYGKFVIHAFDFQGIGELSGIEHRLELMIPVAPLVYNIETKVNLGAGECNHIAIIIISVANLVKNNYSYA